MHSHFHLFQFIFEGKKIEPNTTVAIAQVSVTTATCVEFEERNAVVPTYADPGKYASENLHKYL